MALPIAATTILYFSQLNLLYDYFDPDTVYLASVSYAYIAQGSGLLLFMVLFRKGLYAFSHRFAITGILCLFIPITFMSLLIRSGAALFVILIITNILIGYILGYGFTMISFRVDSSSVGSCWGFGYALGNVLSWLLTRVDTEFITSLKIIPIVCVVTGVSIIPVLLSDNFPKEKEYDYILVSDHSAVKDRIISRFRGIDRNRFFDFVWISLVLVLMSLIYTISSADYSMIAEDQVISSTFYTRLCYAAGLILAGFIYDKSHTASAIIALVSIIYPIMAYMLLKQDFYPDLIYCLSYFFLGFFAVFRSLVFISIGKISDQYLYLAGLGMLISRFTEGLFSLVNVHIARTEVGGFILSGVLFVPLIIVFFMRFQVRKPEQPGPMSDEEKLTELAKSCGLTRREEETLVLLVSNATNSEIAASLTISESTARFHVSNVLKKTDCRTRNELIHKFRLYSKM
ncbi:MAG: helix-turn-helix transcriptional regulator [Parasporobacterium sp.]|nr:helix-turn-helix transcriptional regulator [Parasporobacterium sp.]